MKTLGDWLAEKPFTLTMSSGYFSFFAHAGVVAALEEMKLQPQAITGSSAGSLIGGLWGAGVPAAELRTLLFNLERKDFWDPALGMGLLRGRRLRQSLAEIAPVEHLEDAAVPLRISVFDVLQRKTVVFTEGPLVPVIAASCALPLLFQPVKIHGRYYLDGGIKDRHGLAGVAADERVFYHHIASRSPWRRPGSTALQIPQRPELQALSIHCLPRLGPGKLYEGRVVFEKAKEGARRALAGPVERLGETVQSSSPTAMAVTDVVGQSG